MHQQDAGGVRLCAEPVSRGHGQTIRSQKREIVRGGRCGQNSQIFAPPDHDGANQPCRGQPEAGAQNRQRKDGHRMRHGEADENRWIERLPTELPKEKRIHA